MRELPILFQGPMVRGILEGIKTNTRRPINRLLGFGKITEFGPSDTPGYDWHFRDRRVLWNDLNTAQVLAACPYGQPGDRLWVRETWSLFGNSDPGWLGYRATYPDDFPPHVERVPPNLQALKEMGYRWQPSIHMPRWASRIDLEVLGIKLERVQDISKEDAKAEGLKCLSKDQGRTYKYGIPEQDGWPGPGGWQWQQWQISPRDAFRALWNSINAKPKPQGGKKPTHYVSYPWSEVDRDERETIKGLPHVCIPNPWVWAVKFKRIKEAA